MSDTLGERLWEATRKAKLKGPTEVAREAGLNPVTVAAYMRDLRGASLEACMAIGKALDCDPFWLFYGKQGDAKAVNYNSKNQEISSEKNRRNIATANMENVRGKIPLYSSALAGPDGSISIGPTMLDLIDAPSPISDVTDAYAVRVSGESMEPRYEAGEIVYCHPRMSVKKSDYIVCQIIDKDGSGIQGYIKKFISIDDNFLIVEQLNPPKKIKFQRDRVKSVHKIILAGV